MNFCIEQQLNEALGDDNRWYCSQAHGKCVDDKDLLITHYIRHGGAASFRRRYEEAMGDDNRWYCSERHGFDVIEARMLWKHYMTHAKRLP